MAYALLIDDNEALVASVKRAAVLAHLELETASTWDEGLALFHVLGPNLVIADYHMPNSRNGLQLLAEIKSLRPSVRVVLVSAYINDEDIEKIMSIDLVDGALRKLNMVATTEAILTLIEEAAQTANDPTDWANAADATVRAGGVSKADLDQLDAWLHKNRAPRE